MGDSIEDIFSHKNVEVTKKYIGVKESENYADIISNDEIKAIEKADMDIKSLQHNDCDKNKQSLCCKIESAFSHKVIATVIRYVGL